MAGNGHIIEVLHFVGAEATLHRARVPPAFPADGHEGRAGRRRCGGRRLHRLFLVVVDAIWRRREADQATRAVRQFRDRRGRLCRASRWSCWSIGALTAATSHLTVVAYLTDIDIRPSGRGIGTDQCRSNLRGEFAGNDAVQSPQFRVNHAMMKGHDSPELIPTAGRATALSPAVSDGLAVRPGLQCAALGILSATLIFFGGFAVFATPCQRIDDADGSGGGRRHHRADRRPVAARRRDRSAEVRQGRAPADQRRQSFCRTRSAAGRDRRRQAAVLLLRRHRPRGARHDRQCRGKRQMGARAMPTAASSWSPTTTTCRAACWKCGRLLANAELEPYPVVNSRLDGGGWMVKPERAAGDVHRIHQVSRRRWRAASSHPRPELPDDVNVVNAADDEPALSLRAALPFCRALM